MGYITETVDGLGWVQEDEFLKNHVVIPDSVLSVSDLIKPITRRDITITVEEGCDIGLVLDESLAQLKEIDQFSLTIKQTKKKSFIARLFGL